MKITIHDKRKIHEIQKEFSLMFPNLRIDFFNMIDENKKSTAKHLLIHPAKTIGECRKVHLKGELDIVPHMTVAELEHCFHNNFGLHAQVFRKVGNDWLETAVGTWTLGKQNEYVSESNSESTLEVV